MGVKFFKKLFTFFICFTVFSVLLNISMAGDDIEFKPVTISTNKLTVTGKGGGNEQPSESFKPVEISSKMLTVTGKGGGNEQPSESFKPIVIMTKTLTVTGK